MLKSSARCHVTAWQQAEMEVRTAAVHIDTIHSINKALLWRLNATRRYFGRIVPAGMRDRLMRVWHDNERTEVEA